MIQNADDNTFGTDVVPTISFSLASSANKWQMRIDCNEIGFDKENIEALCRIGHSTKKGQGHTTGYIGEKGIGFKSVFKVADVVHVSSKGYSFRFDRRGVLGMITPIPEEFPPANLIRRLAGQNQQTKTQLLLELVSKSKFKEINNELHKLKPQMLIFLRKIRKLVIHIPDYDVLYEIQNIATDKNFGGQETATLISTSLKEEKKDKYLVVRRLIHSLAEDERRKNVEETEVVLAFPVDANGRPLVRAQDVYAYLPIQDYGFNVRSLPLFSVMNRD